MNAVHCLKYRCYDHVMYNAHAQCTVSVNLYLINVIHGNPYVYAQLNISVPLQNTP